LLHLVGFFFMNHIFRKFVYFLFLFRTRSTSYSHSDKLSIHVIYARLYVYVCEYMYVSHSVPLSCLYTWSPFVFVVRNIGHSRSAPRFSRSDVLLMLPVYVSYSASQKPLFWHCQCSYVYSPGFTWPLRCIYCSRKCNFELHYSDPSVQSHTTLIHSLIWPLIILFINLVTQKSISALYY